jgi:hypothetical protein
MRYMMITTIWRTNKTAVLGIAAATLIAACSESLVDPIVPAQVKVGHYVFACGTWIENGKPSTPNALFDLGIKPLISADEWGEKPSAERLTEISNVGGEITHVFPVSRARVRIPVDSISVLYKKGTIADVWSIPDSLAFGLSVMAIANRRLSPASLRYIENNLGAAINSILFDTSMLSLNIADSRIPELRGFAGIFYVEPVIRLCGS